MDSPGGRKEYQDVRRNLKYHKISFYGFREFVEVENDGDKDQIDPNEDILRSEDVLAFSFRRSNQNTQIRQIEKGTVDVHKTSRVN